MLASVATSGHGAARDRELTESPDFRVRVQAALRLGRASDAATRAAARPDLEAGLRDTHPAVRVACAVALGGLGEGAAVPALQQAMKTESFASVKSAMKDSIEKLTKGGPSGAGAAGDGASNVERAKYVVQLGAMRDGTGQRGDVGVIMRGAARARAGTIKGAMVLDAADSSVLKRAGERKIPVLLVDANLTRLSQSTAKDGGVVVSAQVDLSIRRIPQQTLRGMVSGNASASDVTTRGITELQNRAVNGAVESAMASVGSEIAALAR
ncbi:MAG: hypothetical protein JWP97_3031 [Labilithrix sp.]|nr:hypothetical protein [Labilithrix sp.]